MRLLIFILLSIATINLFANNSPFVAERITTDFNSVLYVNGKLLCFGNYGIITHSTDEGYTWQQTKLNEKYNIYKVIQVNNILVGITQNALIKSTDNGTNWEIKDLSDTLLAITGLKKGTIAILTKDRIIEYDLSIVEINNVTLNPSYLAKEITSLGNTVYLPIQDFKLLKYDFEKRESETVNLNNSINCSSCMKANSIQMNNNKLFLIANNDLYESSDLGANWQSISKGITTNYLIDSGKVYTVECERGLKPIYTPQFSGNPKYLYYLNYYQNSINGFKYLINTDTIIDMILNKFTINNIIKSSNKVFVVGNNNLISLSNNNGNSFRIKSLLNSSLNRFNYVNNNIISFNIGNEIYFTANSGLTWNLRQYQPEMKDIGSMSTYTFREDGRGVKSFLVNNTSQEKSIGFTTNYGKTFELDYNYNNDKAKWLVTSKSLNDKYLILSTIFFKGEQQTTLISHYRLDFKKDTVIRLDSIQFQDIYEAEDKTLYAYGFYQTNYFADSLGNIDYQIKKNKLFKSLDRGLSWIEINTEIPFSTTNPVGKILDNKILASVGSLNIYSNYWNHVVYDISKNTFDSITYPVNIKPKNIPIKFNDYYLFIATNENYLYYTKELYAKNAKWDSVKLEDLFPQWKSYNYDNQNYLGDNALSIIGGDDKELVLNIQKSEFYFEGSYTGKLYMNGIARLKLKSSTSVLEENSKAYLYNYKPYPIPAVNSVKSLIYWNSSYKIEEAEIGIYDIFGAKLNNINYSIQKLEPYSGNLIVDCTNIPSGVYFARIALGGENLNIPIIVSK